MQYFTTFVIYSFWVRLKNFSIHILMKLVTYNVNCISFLIAVHSTLCLNPQNFYFMNDVLFFLHVFANSSECVFYLNVKLVICTKFRVYTAIYCCYKYLSTVQKWNFTFHDQISVTSEPGSTGCEKILIYLSELLCMWPAIFLIAPGALIIPGTWYVLNECLCHI